MADDLLDDGVNFVLGDPYALGSVSQARFDAEHAVPEPEVPLETVRPDDLTVAEVKAHVEAHPDQIDDVLAAEVDGKNRVTLVEWLENYEAPEAPAGDRAEDNTKSEENSP